MRRPAVTSCRPFVILSRENRAYSQRHGRLSVRHRQDREPRMGASLWAYITSLGRWGYVVLAAILGTLFGVIMGLMGKNLIDVPLSGWVAMGYGVLIIVPFLAFHNLHQKYRGLLSRFDNEGKIRGLLDLLQEMHALRNNIQNSYKAV